MAIVLLVLATAGLDAASGIEKWVHRYGNVVSNAVDAASKCILDSRGDLIVIGTTIDHSTQNDFLTLKYSGADGSLLWQRRYDGPAHGNDVPSSVAVDGQGHVVVTGYSEDEQGYPDIYTVKYAGPDGAMLWEKRYAGLPNTRNEAHAVAVDGHGDVVVTGYSQIGTFPDIYTAKYAGANGALLWEKRYNGPEDSWDEARALALDRSGNVAVAGFSTKSDGYQNFYAAKYAATDGALLWERRYSSPNGAHSSVYDVATDVSGNVLLAGVAGGATQGFYTTKLAAADGATLWEKTYAGPGVALALAVGLDGDVVTTGVTWNIKGYDSYTAKYASADGALLWERPYNGPANLEDRTHAVTVDAAGDVLVAGYTDRSGPTSSDYYTAKYAGTDGRLLWEQRYNGSVNWEDQAASVAADADGNVFVTGFSTGTQFNSDCYTAKYRANDGTRLWEKLYRGVAQSLDQGHAVAVDTQGNVVMAGLSSNDYESTHYLAKYSPGQGTLLWERRHYDATHADQALTVAVDKIGDVGVAGFSWQDDDHYTAKYAGADGALLWQTRNPGVVLAQTMTMDASGNVVVVGASISQSGFTNFYTAKHAATDGRLLWKKIGDALYAQDRIVSVAVDATGNVLVTGPSFGTNYNFDYYTAKYAEANGALLWEKRYNGPKNWNDFPSAITVDARGNVVVTGQSEEDYLTVKYAAANGALLWEKRYNGPGNGPDLPHAVALAVNGDVVVSGSSFGTQFNLDYYTARYAAANGALLWEQRYNAPANRDDVAVAVAVNSDGDVVVTGSSYNSNDNPDYLTVKYAGPTGALLWEQRYNGPADRFDFPLTDHSLALGPGGMVVVTGTSDSRSGNAVEYDFATVLYMGSATITPLTTQVGYQLRFPSLAGQRYVLQRAPFLNGPWTALTTGTVPASGVVVYADLAPFANGGFYRLSPP